MKIGGKSETARTIAESFLAVARTLADAWRLAAPLVPDAELRIVGRSPRPPLHAAGGLEPRDAGDEMAARHVVRGRKGLTLRVVRALLGDGRPPERAADDDATERARLTAELARDGRPVDVHPAMMPR